MCSISTAERQKYTENIEKLGQVFVCVCINYMTGGFYSEKTSDFDLKTQAGCVSTLLLTPKINILEGFKGKTYKYVKDTFILNFKHKNVLRMTQVPKTHKNVKI